MFDLWSEASLRVVFAARHEAGSVGCPLIDTEHLLLGLVRVDPASVREIGAAVSIEQIKMRAQEWHVDGKSIPTFKDLATTDDLNRVFERASVEAKAAGCRVVRTEHVLFALMSETGCHAAVILEERGGRLESARSLLRSVDGSTGQVRMEFDPPLTFD
jgi:ATP-dependent Clp protease ATP-binding subunit ClpC